MGHRNERIAAADQRRAYGTSLRSLARCLYSRWYSRITTLLQGKHHFAPPRRSVWNRFPHFKHVLLPMACVMDVPEGPPGESLLRSRGREWRRHCHHRLHPGGGFIASLHKICKPLRYVRLLRLFGAMNICSCRITSACPARPAMNDKSSGFRNGMSQATMKLCSSRDFRRPE